MLGQKSCISLKSESATQADRELLLPSLRVEDCCNAVVAAAASAADLQQQREQ